MNWLFLIFIFFSYSFFGWVLETVYSTIKKRHFINRGVMNGPWCPVYGVAAVVIMIAADELAGAPFFLFVGSAVIAAFIEFITGKILEYLFQKKLWDYSNMRFHADGYICLRFAIVWGVLGVLSIMVFNPLLSAGFLWLMKWIQMVVVFTLTGLFVIDFVCTFSAIFHYQRKNERIEGVNKELKVFTNKLGNAIGKMVIRRMEKNFPGIPAKRSEKKKEKTVFAKGCSFYKLVLLFIIGAFLGDIIETIFCYITTGRLMSRSSVVYGPFSVVWGLGVVILTATLYRFKDGADRYLILAGTILGGVYEYLCSVFTELVFGTVFWDYSNIPFNLGGRINLLYCFFWGIAAIIWLKGCYPYLSGWIEKIPMKAGKIITWAGLIFMICNMSISVLALVRYNERHSKIPTENALDIFLDEEFPDDKMERIYPNAIMK